ncbi:MAG: DUF5329 family protein [Candidatus Omnitrophica bacterium]|nr:DUF5329 family protein [Candidatus Omnitrophota bacterium]
MDPPPTVESFSEYLTEHSRLQESEKEKTNYLFARIRASACQFDRNGQIVSSERAATFLRWKMLRSKWLSQVNTAKDFVEIVTKGSSMSGRRYNAIYADGKRYDFREVMKKELAFLEDQLALQNPSV